MNILEWRNWYSNQPLGLKWIVIIILIRPIIDNFYYLKHISPLLSPLFIVGALTPIFCISAINRFPKPTYSSNDEFFKIWSILLFISSFILVLKKPTLGSAESFVKVTMPIYLFFFLRRLIHNLKDLQAILFTFILASYIAGCFLLYEIIFNPIQEIEYSRGLQRYRGGYADVMNYGIYMSLGLICSAYFFIKNIKIRILTIDNFYCFVIYAILIAIKINHMASYVVLACIISMIFLYMLKGQAGVGTLILFIALAFGSYYGETVFQERINPLIEKDLLVLEGEKDETALLHGRVGRWQYLWAKFQKTNLISRLFGTGAEITSGYLMGAGTHNDFLRIIFTTGWIGFIAYLFFLLRIFLSSRRYLYHESFLALSSIAALLLYSITTTPTFYVNFMYFFLAVAALFSLNPETVYETPEA